MGENGVDAECRRSHGAGEAVEEGEEDLTRERGNGEDQGEDGSLRNEERNQSTSLLRISMDWRSE